MGREGSLADLERKRREARTGPEWLDVLLLAHANVSFQLAWIQFMFGQMGPTTEPEKIMALTETFAADIDDFVETAEAYATVLRDLLANARAKL